MLITIFTSKTPTLPARNSLEVRLGVLHFSTDNTLTVNAHTLFVLLSSTHKVKTSILVLSLERLQTRNICTYVYVRQTRC